MRRVVYARIITKRWRNNTPRSHLSLKKTRKVKRRNWKKWGRTLFSMKKSSIKPWKRFIWTRRVRRISSSRSSLAKKSTSLKPSLQNRLNPARKTSWDSHNVALSFRMSSTCNLLPPQMPLVKQASPQKKRSRAAAGKVSIWMNRTSSLHTKFKRISWILKSRTTTPSLWPERQNQSKSWKECNTSICEFPRSQTVKVREPSSSTKATRTCYWRSTRPTALSANSSCNWTSAWFARRTRRHCKSKSTTMRANKLKSRKLLSIETRRLCSKMWLISFYSLICSA